MILKEGLILVASVITGSGFVGTGVGSANLGKEVTDAVVAEVSVQCWPWDVLMRRVESISGLSSSQFQGLALPSMHAGVDGFPSNGCSGRACGASVLGVGRAYDTVHKVQFLGRAVGVPLEARDHHVGGTFSLSVLTGEGPAAVRVLRSSGITVGKETNVHDFADLLVGGIQLGKDELVASWTQSLEVQVHLNGVAGCTPSD